MAVERSKVPSMKPQLTSERPQITLKWLPRGPKWLPRGPQWPSRSLKGPAKASCDLPEALSYLPGTIQRPQVTIWRPQVTSHRPQMMSQRLKMSFKGHKWSPKSPKWSPRCPKQLPRCPKLPPRPCMTSSYMLLLTCQKRRLGKKSCDEIYFTSHLSCNILAFPWPILLIFWWNDNYINFSNQWCKSHLSLCNISEMRAQQRLLPKMQNHNNLWVFRKNLPIG